jgi:hypothetical protein
MAKRIQKVLLGVAALAAMGLGGAVFANAQSAPSSAPEHASVPDRDSVQSGDQTTPDKPAAARTSTVSLRAASATAPSTAPADPTQSGDQTAPDKPGAGSSEQPGAESPEQSAETPSASDGPGGYADPAGGNAQTDQQGEH